MEFAIQNSAGRLRNETKDGKRRHRFSEARFAHKRDGLAGEDGHGKVSHRPDLAAFGVETDGKIANFEEGFIHGCSNLNPRHGASGQAHLSARRPIYSRQDTICLLPPSPPQLATRRRGEAPAWRHRSYGPS